MDLLLELSWRGLIHQTTDDERLPKWLAEGSRKVYAGFDPTADSLHVGSMVPLLMLRRFQKAGHQPIILIGGATGMIGDPSGKSEERNLLSVDVLQNNVAALELQMRQFLDFDDSATAAELVNNHDWLKEVGYLDFLRDVGKSFPVGVMMGKDSVRSRLQREEGGMSYTEFSYMLLQAYDFVYLNERFGCELQVGGSDQWGNITAGIDLARRLRAVQLYGLTHPLLTKSDGTKMGKTEQGAIWLAPERTSPYQFYQYWFRVEDADVGHCLRMLTDLAREEIESLDSARLADASKHESQRRLAEEMTRVVHGPSGLETARRATEVFFGGEIQPQQQDDGQLKEIFEDVPSEELPRERLAGDGLSVVDSLVLSGLCQSKGAARRTIQQGGAYVNNRRVQGIDTQLSTTDLASPSIMVLRTGKKNYALLRFV